MDMSEIEDQARSQLMMIEQVYGLKITNREEVAKLIAGKVNHSRQVLTICSSLNSWVLLNKKRGEVIIPSSVLTRLFDMVDWQDKNA